MKKRFHQHAMKLAMIPMMAAALSFSSVVAWGQETDTDTVPLSEVNQQTQPEENGDTERGGGVSDTLPVPQENRESENAPHAVIPTMEVSSVQSSYQSYETIYVALSAPAGYTIYYTLDGSDAQANGIAYTKVISIEAPSVEGGSITLNAIAIRSSGAR